MMVIAMVLTIPMTGGGDEFDDVGDVEGEGDDDDDDGDDGL